MCIQDGDGIGWVIYYLGKEEREVVYCLREESNILLERRRALSNILYGKMWREVIYYLGKAERDMGIAPFHNSGRNSVKRAKILDFAKILEF